MRFLIYGAGALGQALGCLLAANGHGVDLLLRKRFREPIERDGLEVSGIYGTHRVLPGTLGLLEAVEEARTTVYDYILLTTKAYDTGKALDNIHSHVTGTAPVVSLQNGCGNIEKLVVRFGHKRSLGARVITGFEIVRPGAVKITVSADAVHVGDSKKGSISPQARNLAAAIDHAGLPCVAVENIHTSLFAKLLYNCALNPLGAILGVHYGLLSESLETRKLMDRVIEETFQVIEKLGGNVPWQDAEAYKELFYQKLLPSTYDHRPSMLQDLESGKPTEVDALVGYVSKKGQELGVSTVTCDFLASLLRFKEQKIH